MSRSQSNTLGACAGETAMEHHDGHLTEVCSAFGLISRGVVSGSDVARLFARLMVLMGGCVQVDPAGTWEDVQLLAEGIHITRKELRIRIGANLSLRVTTCAEGFSSETIEIARLLAPSLSACLASPTATQALGADPDESLDEALARLVAYVKLNLHGEVLEWSEASLLLMRNKCRGIAMEEVESALLSAVQAFLRGERVVHRIAPELVASFAFAAQHAEAEDILIAALHPQSDADSHAMDSPAAALLTPTEIRITKLLMTGKSETLIANELGVSRETVRTHRKRIYQKVGAESRASLVLLFTPAS